ncbi:M-phase phosphoprotein 6 [Mortierella polycephala]|uniref:M-phase phosphoprotein 6 n=1 Tax=Mortierella polycephala TaxID=41804 RepID=A0A9P6QC54_9FUNG|nr:M-phase phosphoprotein 6 [Mortierella polycephala]
MATEIPHKKALSDKLLTMKFMQRLEERKLREKLEQEQVRVVTEAHWVLDHKGVELPKPKFQVEYEPSYLQMDAAERSSIGRVSFQKFNEPVEKTASTKAGEQQLDRELKRERQGAVEDEELAEKMGHSNKAKKAKTSQNSASKPPKTNRRVPPSNGGSGKGNGGSSGGKGSNNSNNQKRAFMKPQA